MYKKKSLWYNFVFLCISLLTFDSPRSTGNRYGLEKENKWEDDDKCQHINTPVYIRSITWKRIEREKEERKKMSSCILFCIYKKAKTHLIIYKFSGGGGFSSHRTTVVPPFHSRVSWQRRMTCVGLISMKMGETKFLPLNISTLLTFPLKIYLFLFLTWYISLQDLTYECSIIHHVFTPMDWIQRYQNFS